MCTAQLHNNFNLHLYWFHNSNYKKICDFSAILKKSRRTYPKDQLRLQPKYLGSVHLPFISLSSTAECRWGTVAYWYSRIESQLCRMKGEIPLIPPLSEPEDCKVRLLSMGHICMTTLPRELCHSEVTLISIRWTIISEDFSKMYN